jgi:hypothetical protein
VAVADLDLVGPGEQGELQRSVRGLNFRVRDIPSGAPDLPSRSPCLLDAVAQLLEVLVGEPPHRPSGRRKGQHEGFSHDRPGPGGRPLQPGRGSVCLGESSSSINTSAALPSVPKSLTAAGPGGLWRGRSASPTPAATTHGCDAGRPARPARDGTPPVKGSDGPPGTCGRPVAGLVAPGRTRPAVGRRRCSRRAGRNRSRWRDVRRLQSWQHRRPGCGVVCREPLDR